MGVGRHGSWDLSRHACRGEGYHRSGHRGDMAPNGTCSPSCIPVVIPTCRAEVIWAKQMLAHKHGLGMKALLEAEHSLESSSQKTVHSLPYT